MTTKVTLDHKDVTEMLAKFIEAKTGLKVDKFKITSTPGQAEITGESYSVEAECN